MQRSSFSSPLRRCLVVAFFLQAGVDASSASSHWSEKVVSGGISRALAQAVLYPVDALKTLSQTRDGRTLADVGTGAVVRGCFQTSSFALLVGALQFGIFAAANDRYGPVVASALGGAGSCLVSVPQDVLKQRLVTGVYPSFRRAVSTIWKTEGVWGFYSAWRPTASRNIPYVITTFTTMELMKKRILKTRRKAGAAVELTSLENMALGMGSAMLAVFMTQPIDVVKTRMMTQAASTAVPYTSALDCAVTILQTEGWRKLYTGLGQRCVYMGGLWGITFAMNGYMNQRFQKQHSGAKKQ